MIIVHHLNNSRSQRILWMLEELGQPYEIKRYERDPETMLAPPSLKQVHPLGKAPVISDGEITLAESGAIIDYLATTYGHKSLLPSPGTAAHRAYSYWLHYAEGSLMPLMVMTLVFDKVRHGPMPFFVKPIAAIIADKVDEAYLGPNIKQNLAFVEEQLAAQDYFAGDHFSGADIQMSFPLETARARGALKAGYPRIEAWLKRMHARPAYQKALAAGGPYEYA